MSKINNATKDSVTSEQMLNEILRIIVSWVKYDSFAKDRSPDKGEFPEKYAVHLRPIQENLEKLETDFTKHMRLAALFSFMEKAYGEQYDDEKLSSLIHAAAEAMDIPEEKAKEILSNPLVEGREGQKSVRRASQRNGSSTGGPKESARDWVGQLLGEGNSRTVKKKLDKFFSQENQLFAPLDLKSGSTEIVQSKEVLSEAEKEQLSGIGDVLASMASTHPVNEFNPVNKRLIEDHIRRSMPDD